MTLTVTQAVVVAIVLLVLAGLCVVQWLWIKVLEKAARQAIQAVHNFAGWGGGVACGPAESELCERCLGLAELIEYEGLEDR